MRVNALATCRNNLGEVLELAKCPVEAELVFRLALEEYRKMAGRFPNDVDYRWGVAMALTNLAAVIVEQDRREDARRLIEESKKIFNDLSGKLGKNSEFQEHLAKHARVRDVLRNYLSRKNSQ